MPLSALEQPVYVAKADLFRALGHPIRIRILELLVEAEQPVSRLLSDLAVEASTMSQHLAVIKRCGLVTSYRKANTVTYRVSDPSVGQFLAAAREVLAATLSRSHQTLKELEGEALR